jgi:hypothetical protein
LIVTFSGRLSSSGSFNAALLVAEPKESHGVGGDGCNVRGDERLLELDSTDAPFSATADSRFPPRLGGSETLSR